MSGIAWESQVAAIPPPVALPESCYWHFCFGPIANPPAEHLFGFSEFIAALALLTVVYTIADIRYRFRLACVPGPLYLSTFIVIGIVGLHTLVSGVWIAQGWWVPHTVGLTPTTCEAISGGLFLGTFMTWMYFALIRPPVFGRRNALKYARALYRVVLRGNDDELKVVGNELALSARSIVQLCMKPEPREDHHKESVEKRKPKRTQPKVGRIAADVLLLLGNRKLCRQIVAASPVTAQAFCEEIASANRYDVPAGQFCRNISSEAIAQKHSFIYEEEEGFDTGLLGYLKPVSLALYGNYLLVENMGNHFKSPLDIDYSELRAWDSKQWAALSRATLMTVSDYLKRRLFSNHSFAIYRAIESFEGPARGVHLLNDENNPNSDEIMSRFQVSADFFRRFVELIQKQEPLPAPIFNRRADIHHENCYDYLAKFAFELLFSASQVTNPTFTSWMVHHNIAWTSVFGSFHNDAEKAWDIVRMKVRRLLYTEIRRMEEFPNYKGARLLGLCLNIVGLNVPSRKPGQMQRGHYALAKAVRIWARKNYLKLRQDNSDVADAVLFGRLTFDESNNRLVVTYDKGLNTEAPKEYLQLDPPPPAAA
ncbi:MAG: hypothetical protein K2X67_06250 [Burkholderiales bacterium]|nr:hypothetical protein [Burkholderiales bacterium]